MIFVSVGNLQKYLIFRMDNVISRLLFTMQKCKKALGSHFSPVTWSVATTPVSLPRECNTLMPIALPWHVEHSPLLYLGKNVRVAHFLLSFRFLTRQQLFKNQVFGKI